MTTESRLKGRAAAPWISALFGLLILTAALPVPSGEAVAQAAPAARAKQDYALIYGTVWGPDNHPVGGVPIKIHGTTAKKAKWDLVSDRNGEFAQRVPAGPQDYIIQAQVKTPKGQPKPEETVHIDDNERKDVGIHLSKETLSPK